VSHSVKCGVCKVYPIVGLRYQCLNCLRYNLCQTCFFTARVSKKHKLRHRVQEHCYEASQVVTSWSFVLSEWSYNNRICNHFSSIWPSLLTGKAFEHTKKCLTETNKIWLKQSFHIVWVFSVSTWSSVVTFISLLCSHKLHINIFKNETKKGQYGKIWNFIPLVIAIQKLLEEMSRSIKSEHMYNV